MTARRGIALVFLAFLRTASAQRGNLRARGDDRRRRIEVPNTRALRTLLSGGTSKRIVNGENISEEAKYFCVPLYDGGDGFYYQTGCGAVLIGRRHALTAAHCISDKVKDDGRGELTALFCNAYAPWVEDSNGNYNDGRHFEIIEVKDITEHPDRVIGLGNPNDIAMIELAGDGSDDLRPIQLADPTYYSSLNPGVLLRATGMGSTSPKGDDVYPAVVQQVDMPFLSDATCQSIIGSSFDESNMCAGGDGGGTCNGDSGGPLVRNDPLYGNVLVGLTSWAFSCNQETPIVFAKVSNFIPWIQSFGIKDLRLVGESEGESEGESGSQTENNDQGNDTPATEEPESEGQKPNDGGQANSGGGGQKTNEKDNGGDDSQKKEPESEGQKPNGGGQADGGGDKKESGDSKKTGEKDKGSDSSQKKEEESGKNEKPNTGSGNKETQVAKSPEGSKDTKKSSSSKEKNDKKKSKK